MAKITGVLKSTTARVIQTDIAPQIKGTFPKMEV
jgi:hypothetical protein